MYKAINPDCLVYAFEPQAMLHKLLKSNVIMNSLPNVVCFNKAVGECNAMVEMNPYSTDGSNNYSNIEYGTDNLYNLAGVQIGTGGEEVEMIAIDSLNLEACDFIKIDVEGYEPHVIEGAINTIKKFKPVISYESNSKVSGKSTISSLERLTRIGYVSMNVWGDNWIAI
jgi:FkbM family methyltransferase